MANPRILASFLILTSTFVAAQADDETPYTPTEEGRQAMVNQLIGAKATPEVTAPFATGDVLPVFPSAPVVASSNSSKTFEKASSGDKIINETPASTKAMSLADYIISCHGKVANSRGYEYVVSFRTKNSNDSESNKDTRDDKFTSLYVSCYDSETGELKMTSSDVSLESFPDFITNSDYLACVRNDYKSKSLPKGVNLDPFNGTASTFMRNSEMLGSFVSISAVDFNGDGVEEPFVCDGKYIYIFEINDSSEVDHPYLELTKIITVNENATFDDTMACTSAAYDMDGDGVDDYVALVIPDSQSSAAPALHAIFIRSTNSSKLELYRKEIPSDQLGFFYYKSNGFHRAMVNATTFCPTGAFGEKWLAIATTTIFDDTSTKVRGMQKLTLIKPDFNKIADGSEMWYTMKSDNTLSRGDYFNYYERVDHTFYDDYHLAEFAYARPTVCQAYLQGISAPAHLLWENAIYVWNPETAMLEREKVLTDRPNRYVGGYAVAAALGSASDFSIDGKEVFATLGTDTRLTEYDSSTDHCYSYSTDTALKLYCCAMDGSNNIKTQSISLGSNPTEATTLLMRPLIAGLKLEAVSQSVTVSTPTVECVLAVPPYLNGKSKGKGNVSFTKSSSSSESMTNSESSSIGVTVGLNYSFANWLKAGIQSKNTESWSKSMSKTLSFSQNTSVSVDKGEDMVSFSYIPVDVFNYKVVSDNPNYDGQTFSLMRARSSGIKSSVMTVKKYNELVGPAGGMVIDSSVLPHTAGDVSSYIHCENTDLTDEGAKKLVVNKFGVLEDEIIAMSNIFDVPDESTTRSVSLGYGEGGSVGEGGSSLNEMTLSFNLLGNTPFSLNASVIKSNTKSWNLSNSWSRNVQIQGSIPSIEDKANNFYSYRLVWYRLHRPISSDTSKDKQDFMVGNWIICEDQTGGTSSAGCISADNHNFDARVFSIDGRYIGTTTDNLMPGIYIRNGRKIVITE